ncbi:MAG: hypothetical protein HS101_00895 [Planctomycetia bacterium]|jgi:tetratricopeptide (TPR) repeat protein|nr:hypothetical protein [Planctomycetia bacterium]MCC7315776.1 hypothetical protein [Planctomycetota bacterium]OQZ05718.1 MAG: hypothetical protein B6D36_08700 [Planctomycetes bacterium UTPLA1]
MAPGRRLTLAAGVAAIIGIGVVPSPAAAQRRAIFQAIQAAQSNRRQPTLLDQMFSRNRPCSTGRCISRPTINFTYFSNGTPYDGFAEASRIARYSDTGFQNSSVGGFSSSNAANSYAPANYQLAPPPGVAPSTLGAAPLSHQLSTFVAPSSQSFSPGPGQYQSPGTGVQLGEALWQLKKARQSGAVIVNSGTGAMTLPPTDISPRLTSRPMVGTVESALKNGAFAFRRGNYGLAQVEYREAMNRGCTDARSRLGLALAEFALGHYEEAANFVQSDLIASPSLNRSSLSVRSAYRRQSEFDTHLRRLLLVLEDQPENSEYLLLAGFMQYYSGDKSGGIANLKRYASSANADARIVSFVRQLAATEIP